MASYYLGEIYIPKKFISEEVKAEIQIRFFDKAYDEGDNIVCYRDWKALDGQYCELENFLKNAKISFDRYSSSHDECSPEYYHYRPASEDMKGIDTVVITDLQGSPYITTSELKKLLELSPEAAQQKLNDLINENDPEIKPLEYWC